MDKTHYQLDKEKRYQDSRGHLVGLDLLFGSEEYIGFCLESFLSFQSLYKIHQTNIYPLLLSIHGKKSSRKGFRPQFWVNLIFMVNSSLPCVLLSVLQGGR